MTVIENNSPKVQYTGPYDIGQLLPLTFPYDQPEDVHMQIGDTEATYNTEYFISGLTPESVTLKEPIDSGVLITIYRETPLDQQSDFPQNARFSSKRIEDALDKICMEQQEQEEKLARCLVAPISLTGFSGALPEAKAGSALIWNETETGFINTDLDLSAEGMADIENVSTHISSVINCSNNMGAITVAPTYAENSRKWAEGTDNEVIPLGGIHSAKQWASLYSHVYVGDTAPTDEEVDVWLCPSGEIVDSAIKTCADHIGEITLVANDLAVIEAVNNNKTNINTTASISGSITILAGISSAISIAAGISSAISAVALNETNINAVATNETNINAAVANATNINAAVANATNINAAVANATNINAAVANATNINAVATNETNINTVASNDTNITTCATNISAITNAPTYATSASNSASTATNQAQIATQQASLSRQYAEETHGQSDVMVENVRAIPAYENYGYAQTESKGLEDLKKFNRSTFDLSKFTKVGTPTITNDGIASGFSDSNYLRLPNSILANIFPKKKWKIQTGIVTITNQTTSRGILFVSGHYSCVFQVNSNRYLYLAMSSNGSTFDIANDKISNIQYEYNKPYIFTIERDENGYFVKMFDINANQEYTIMTISSTADVYVDSDTNFPKIGYDSWYSAIGDASIDLKQFSISADGEEVFNGNRTGIDTIKADNYTAVGTPTISADGLATVDNSNRITLSLSDWITANNWKIEYPISHTQTNLAGIISITGDNSLQINYTPSGKVVYYSLSSNGTGWDIASSNFTATNLDTTQDGTFIIEFTGTQYLLSVVQNGTVVGSVTISSTSKLYNTGTALILGNTRGANASTDGTIDLNQVKIYANGSLVAQPLLRIPYNQSKTGSKIVQYAYRGRVQDMYSQYGWANYYTLLEERKPHYTVVGSPTISSDYVASGFSSSNYLNASVNLTNSNSIEIVGRFKINSLSSGDASIIGISSWDANIGCNGSTLYATFGGASIVSSLTLETNTEYDFILEYTTSQFSFSVKKINSNTYTTNTGTPSGTFTYTGITFGNGAGGAFTNGSIDLKQPKIYVDNNLVYQAVEEPNFTLPYGENLDGHVTKIDWYKNGTTSWEYDTNLDCTQTGSCTSGTAVTLPKPMADDTYSLSVPYSAKSKTGFTPTATGDYMAKGKVVLG